MNERLHPALAALLLLPALASPALAGGIQILGKPELGSPTSIQVAVDLAADGDHLLVGPGTYEGFSIEGKGLVLIAPTPGSVTIQGTVRVREVGWKQLVVLSGLDVTGATRFPRSDPGLELTGNLGQVRLQDCTFRGGVGEKLTDCEPWGDGGYGATLDDNTRVALVRCTLLGGAGYGIQNGNYECLGGDGGHGMLATDSAVALYDCTLRGGKGGVGGLKGGDGGDGGRVTTFGVFASNTDFTGAHGALGWDTFGLGGDGGDGLVIEGSAQGQLLDCTFSGGLGGQGIEANGTPGNTWSGTGVIKFHAGAARALVAEGLAIEGTKVPFAVSGAPGDRIFLTSSFVPDWFVPVPKTGVWLVPPPKWFEWPPLAVLPASGQGGFQWPGLAIQSGEAARTLFMQGYALDAAAKGVLGSPLHLTVLNRDGLPDCNGNGVLDVLDVLEGTSLDLDGNLNPDECDPDCNGNGIIDGLEALVGKDANGNGVLDECEDPGPVLVVDASASGPGTGSAAEPYRTLGLAFARAASGDTIVVRDGVYTGASNRELDFAGRDLTVASANGAAACTLDCRGWGRAFVLDSGEGLGARIEGFTIVNGDASSSPLQTGRGGAIGASGASPVVSACVIRDCQALYGGALELAGGTIEDTWIEDCNATVQGGGFYAAWQSSANEKLLVRRSTVRACAAQRGGGAYVSAGSKQSLISHCRLEENDATLDGGGLLIVGQLGLQQSIDDCLLAGNTAGGRGGGVYVGFSDAQLTNSLWVGNHAAGGGGALALVSSADGDLLNSIVWDCTQGTGSTIEVLGQGLKVARSDVQGGMAAVGGTGALNWATGNLDADPLFVDPDGPDRDPLTFLDNDYRLGAGSPCVDSAGNGNVPPDKADVDDDLDLLEPVPLDLDLAPRFVDDPAVPDTGGGTAPIVDMGPYERAP